MRFFKNIHHPKLKQYLISIFLVIIVSTTCFTLSEIIGNKTVALVLLVMVSLIAMTFDILPVLISATLSALIWNYFFIPPLYTFHIKNADDILMFFMYLAIALVNAVLTFKIRKEELKARDKEENVKSIKLYNTLINCLSHELKTPISTIMGAVDTLIDEQETLPKSIQNELLAEINIASLRLNRQVENLLNMNRLESGFLKLNLIWSDLNELIYSVIQKINPIDLDHKIEFESSSESPLCKIDEGLIEQVIYNLIHNALIYTPKGSVIKIDFKVEDNVCKIMVEDNGTGIPQNEMDHIFKKFYRVSGSKSGGTGLGLSIVKGFVNAHNGEVYAENLPKGCRFIVKLPCETSYINQLNNE
jgi:two-component system, OmpR family, sensor histidine kinase KdpD